MPCSRPDSTRKLGIAVAQETVPRTDAYGTVPSRRPSSSGPEPPVVGKPCSMMGAALTISCDAADLDYSIVHAFPEVSR